jgi:hypothetical protein
MDQIAYYFFTLPKDAWRKKPSRSAWSKTIAEAAQQHPGAEPILDSVEYRSGKPLTPHSSPPMPGSDAWKRLHGEAE